MTEYQVKVSASNDRGSFVLNQRIKEGNPLAAVEAVMERWMLSRQEVWLVHVEPVKAEPR